MELPEAVRTALDVAPHCFLATCHNSVPNVVPVGHKWIVDNRVLLGDFHFGKTRRNLVYIHCPRAARAVKKQGVDDMIIRYGRHGHSPLSWSLP